MAKLISDIVDYVNMNIFSMSATEEEDFENFLEDRLAEEKGE